MTSMLLLGLCSIQLAVVPWPAESWLSATNLTAIEGPGTNDFYVDMSAAVFDSSTRRLWVARNGPSPDSKLWALKESGSSWVVDTQATRRAEWTGLGDLEAITYCPATPNAIYCASEGEQFIRVLDVSVYGVLNVTRVFNLAAQVPYLSGKGIEGLAFIPNEALARGGMTTSTGAPMRSTLGLGGLFFVGNQGDGRIYIFDLSPTSTTFVSYGSLATNYPEISELTFDWSTDELLVLHGNNQNTIEVSQLTATGTGTTRHLVEHRTYDRPLGSATNANIEGIAILTDADCSTGNGAHAPWRSLFMTIDGGGAQSLLWFHQWPCTCPADVNADGSLDFFDYLDFVDAFTSLGARADFNGDGAVDFFDYLDFVDRFTSGC
jgi:uncharacterized protein YjiK